jgi:hypothetical protein
MNNKELREFVVAKFDARKVEFNQLKKSVEAFAITILIDCKDVLVELDSAQKVFGIIIDEIDDRTNTGALDLIDGTLIKGAFEKFINSPKLEAEFLKWRDKAISVIDSQRGDGRAHNG